MITSLTNKMVKEVVDLKKTGARKKNGLIIIDGLREIDMALRGQVEIVTIFYCPEINEDKVGILKQIDPNKRVDVSCKVFKKICYKENPDGFLAVAKPKKQKLATIELSDNPLVIILENVEKPGNIGGIIRTAYASGVEAIIINNNQTDIYNPNVIRASEGYVFTENIVIASIDETMKWLKDRKIKSFGAATMGAKVYSDVDLGGASAIVLGSEAKGLSKKWLEGAGKLIKIPMQEGVDSLNVSVSAAVMIYEAVRQRGVK